MTPTTTEELRGLKRLAEAATPGPWEWHPGHRTTMGDFQGPRGSICDFGDATQYYPTEGTPPSDADAAFIAAANPQTVLALLGRIEEADKENKRLRKAMDVQKRAAFTLADATQKIADAKVKHYVEKDRSEYYAEQSLDSERGMNAILTEENEALTAQVSQLEEALERQHGDIGFLISTINGVREATGEGPEEEDAAIFWQINYDHAKETRRRARAIWGME